MRVSIAVHRGPAGDGGLELRVLADEFRIPAEGVPERDVPAHVAARGLDVEMDAEFVAVVQDRADEHRPGRRPRIRARLVLESEVVEEGDDRRDVRRRRLDREVHDALAGQGRDGGAADVLDMEVGAARLDQRRDGGRDVHGPRVPCRNMRHAALIRKDGEVVWTTDGSHGMEV